MEKTTSKPNIVFMGTPGFAAGILTYLIEKGYDIRGVVTVPDKPSGRGLSFQPSAVKEVALKAGLPLLQPALLKDPIFLEQLAAWHAGIFVVVAFRMLPSVVWEMPKLGCFNLHASLLPDYRGAAPLNHVLINGENETGITTFLIDKQIDTGLILLQEKTRIVPSDNAGSLHDRLMEMGGPLVARTIDGLWAGTLKGISQPDTQAEKLNPAPKIYRETCLIHWDREATQIVNLIRGLSPVPCAFGMLKKDDSVTEIKIYEARAEHDQHSLPPGKIITDGKKIFKVACRDGYIHLNEVRAPGRKKLDIASFLAGFRDPGNARFI